MSKRSNGFLMDNELNKAVEHISLLFADFDNQTLETQSTLKGFLKTMGDQIVEAERRQREKDRVAAAYKRDSQRARQKVRDEMIPTWCEENLEPGMIVKVKAKNSSFRRIISVTPRYEVGKTKFIMGGELRGQHVSYKRVKTDDGFTARVQEGDYITNHALKYVQGVVAGVDERGLPIVTPIMDLIEKA